jgi:hypothetical protein
MNYLQQGDVLLHCETIPPTARTKVLDPVIERGEHTGHAHRLSFDMGHEQMREGGGLPKEVNPKWEHYLDEDTKKRYLRVLEPIDLTHEEHNKITIPPGDYRIGRVLEYDHFAEEARIVQD